MNKTENKKKLPTLLVPKGERVWDTKSAIYLVTIDEDQKKKHYFKTEDGGTGMLHIPTEFVLNNLYKHPNVATVVEGFGDTTFKKGDEIVCHHYTFAFSDTTLKVFWTDPKTGIDYYRVREHEIYFSIKNERLVPREGILLCEALKDKVYETFLTLPDSLIDERRDVVRVLDTWEGCTQYKKGDYVIVEEGGDYPFEMFGREFIKVDAFRDDAMAVVDTKDVRKKNWKRRVRDHTKKAGE